MSAATPVSNDGDNSSERGDGEGGNSCNEEEENYDSVGSPLPLTPSSSEGSPLPPPSPSPYPTQSQSQSPPSPAPPSRSRSRARTLGRSLTLLRSTLTAVFLILVVSVSLLHVYDEYVERILSAVKWMDNNRLPHEHTYYSRECQREDMSTFDASDLVIGPNSTTAEAADSMMRHGFGLIGQVLTPDTTARMREFVLRRNAGLTKAESIPLDGKESRWSFAIGANEDPIVPVALREVATHPVVKPMLEALVGPNPAVVEITAITSDYEAEHQGWHADVKPLGNAVKYARTFVHSYSLFIALQDTTPDMGATEVCPGTHYCSNSLTEVCFRDGFKVTNAGGIWRAGDSLLINQCSWHRGTAHTDPAADKRAVFIVTFVSRPNFGVDRRQLAHGTYFHIRWDMWGHTLQDLIDAPRHMAQPWAEFRSLGLWKPKGRQWGWDWLTVTCLRIANQQNGYTGRELVNWYYEQFVPFGLPSVIHGPLPNDDEEDEEAWQTFIHGTLMRTVHHSALANLLAIATYLILVALLRWCSVNKGDISIMGPLLKRLGYTHVTILTLALGVQYALHQSAWAKSLRNGSFLKRPFPNPATTEEAVSIKGPTTTPSRYDVLIGSRFDSREIGIYNEFLDYHPGNVYWQSRLRERSPAFAYYAGSQLMQDVISRSIVSDQKGRLLLQSVFGEWLKLSTDTSSELTRRALLKMICPVLGEIDQEIAFMLADARYGPSREMSLAHKHGQKNLLDLREKLFVRGERRSSVPASISIENESTQIFSPRLFSLPPVPRSEPNGSRQLLENHDFVFKEGDHILANYESDGVWFDARLREILDDGEYHVDYADGYNDRAGYDMIRPFMSPLEDGDKVKARTNEGPCFGTIAYISPHEFYRISCENGFGDYTVPYELIERIF